MAPSGLRVPGPKDIAPLVRELLALLDREPRLLRRAEITGKTAAILVLLEALG